MPPLGYAEILAPHNEVTGVSIRPVENGSGKRMDAVVSLALLVAPGKVLPDHAEDALTPEFRRQQSFNVLHDKDSGTQTLNQAQVEAHELQTHLPRGHRTRLSHDKDRRQQGAYHSGVQ